MNFGGFGCEFDWCLREGSGFDGWVLILDFVDGYEEARIERLVMLCVEIEKCEVIILTSFM